MVSFFSHREFHIWNLIHSQVYLTPISDSRPLSETIKEKKENEMYVCWKTIFFSQMQPISTHPIIGQGTETTRAWLGKSLCFIFVTYQDVSKDFLTLAEMTQWELHHKAHPSFGDILP